MKTNNITNFLGNIFIISAYLFILVFIFVVTGSGDDGVTRDLLGFEIPHAPVWTSYIPYLGWVLNTIFEFFSLHGIVGIVIFITLSYIGHLLKNE